MDNQKEIMAAAIADIKSRMEKAARAAGRNPHDVKLLPVTKTKPAAMLQTAYVLGLHTFGENYIQEARDKFAELSALEISWHFIGHLQSNKAKYAVKMFGLIHSVDSLSLAEALNKEAGKIGKVQRILVQVNEGGEASKAGVTPEATLDLIKAAALLPNLKILGLMTLPPFFDNPEAARPFFADLRKIRDEINAMKIPGVELSELSMGMTGDFEAAIAEGSTMVRIGTALFGARA